MTPTHGSSSIRVWGFTKCKAATEVAGETGEESRAAVLRHTVEATRIAIITFTHTSSSKAQIANALINGSGSSHRLTGSNGWGL